MARENRYGEYECPANGCRSVFAKPERRDRHYRRVHCNIEYKPNEHGPRLSREELLTHGGPD